MKKRSLISLLIVLCMVCLMGCGGESQYDKDLRNGVEKYEKGEKMTKGEYEAVNNMKEWSAKQNENNAEKSYSDWNR